METTAGGFIPYPTNRVAGTSTSLMSPNSEPTHIKGTVTLDETEGVEKEQ